MKRAAIIGTGKYVPEKILLNTDLEKMVDTTDEWITQMTGIKKRYIASDDQAASDLGYEAAKNAIADAGIDKNEIDLVLCSTLCPDYLFPATACVIADKLGLAPTPAFDLSAACSGFVFGLTTAAQYIQTGMYKTILLVSTEAMSKVIDWNDRNTCVLFGDGAGAVVLRADESGAGVFASFMGTDGSIAPYLLIPAGGSRSPASHETVDERQHYLKMDGRRIFNVGVTKFVDAVNNVCANADMDVHDIDLMITHQANIRINTMCARQLDFPFEKTFNNLEDYGNTSSATIPIALRDAIDSGRVEKDMTLCFVGFGGGFTWGSVLLKW